MSMRDSANTFKRALRFGNTRKNYHTPSLLSPFFPQLSSQRVVFYQSPACPWTGWTLEVLTSTLEGYPTA
jgi:hypothetical protein